MDLKDLSIKKSLNESMTMLFQIKHNNFLQVDEYEVHGKIGEDFSFSSYSESGLFYKISNFSICVSLIGLVQLFNSKTLLDKFELLDQNEAMKYSASMFFINIIWNAFVTWGNFFLSMFDERMFNDFIIPSLLFFINFTYYEIKIILAIWKADLISSNRQNDFHTALRILKNRFVKIYVLLCKILLLILVIIVLATFFYAYQIFFWKPFIYIIFVTTFTPQIALNFRKGKRHYISTFTIVIISVNKLFIPLYFRMCIHNFLEMPIDNRYGCTLIFIISLQLLMFIFQRVVGFRKLCRTCGYNYNKTFDELKLMNLDIENVILFLFI